MQKGSRYFRSLALALSVLCGGSLFAVDEFELDCEYLEKLVEIEFIDYAQMQLQGIRRQYPDKKDAINLATARMNYATGKVAEADKLVNAIPENSPAYVAAVILKGEMSFLRKKFPEAEAAYKKYFAKVTEAPKGRSKQEQYKRAVMVYSRVLKEMGKGKEAAEVIGKLEGMKGGVGDERQMQFMKVQAKVDAEQMKIDDGKPVNVTDLQAAIKELQALEFVRDGAGASAYIQVARAQIIIGRNALRAAKTPDAFKKINNFKAAIASIKTADAFLEELESTMSRGERSKSSPVAEAMFYKAQAIQYQAQVTQGSGNAELGRKQLKGAVKYYEALLETYPDTALRSQILIAMNDCSKYSEEKYGEKIEIAQGDGGDAIDAKIEQAETLFANKEYARCAELYLEAVRSGRRSRKLPNVVMRLAIAYGQMGEYELAEALISYIADAMPKEENSAEAAYRFGGILYEQARKEKNPDRQQELYARAFASWDIFVNLNPAHAKAPDVAFAVAEMKYKQASDMVAKATQEKDAKKKEALQKRALQLFYDAIPAYQRMTEVFSSSDKGVRALYKLGWINHTINSNPKEIIASIKNDNGQSVLGTNFVQNGVDAFTSYYDEETNLERSEDRMEAKFRAAELLLFSDAPLEAVPHFQEIAEVCAGKLPDKGIRTTEPVAKRVNEDAAAYLPWAYDLAGEHERQAIAPIKAKQDIVRGKLKKFNTVKDEVAPELADIEKEAEALAEEEKNVMQVVAEADLDFEAMARRQLKADFDKAEALAGDEKTKQLAELNNAVKNQLAALEEQKKSTLQGEITSLEEGMPTLAQAKKTTAKEAQEAEQAVLKLNGDKQTLQAEKDKLDKEALALSTSMKAVEKDIVEAEAEKQRLEAANANLDQISAKLDELYRKKAEVATEENSRKLENLNGKIYGLEKELAEFADREALAQFNLAAAKLKVQLAEANALIAERRMKLDRETMDALAKTGDERNVRKQELAKLGGALSVAQKKLSDMYRQLFDLRRKEAQRKIASADNGMKAAEAELAEFDQQIKPIQAKVDEQKKRAVTAFNAYLAKYPSARKAPDNMARLGTIYMDLGDNDKAKETLNKLTTQFPDSQAAKTAGFNLGRAQMEAGDVAGAAKSFKELFARQDAINGLKAFDLSYVLDNGMKMGAPEAVTRAAKRVVDLSQAKSKSEEIPTYLVDKAYVRSAEAYLSLQQYAQALGCIRTLLEKNPNTAYFYDVKFISAEANMKNGQNDAAMKDLEEILKYSNQDDITARARYMLGSLLLASDEQKAMATFQVIAVLGNVKEQGSRPWIEKAYLEYAKLLKKNGKTEDLHKALEKYRKDFPDGQMAAELSKLAK